MDQKHFEGKPCSKCGATLRYVSTPSKCVRCNRAATLAKNKAEYTADPEIQRKRSTAWRSRNKDREAARYKRWAAENRQRKSATEGNRRARLRSVPGEWTQHDIDLRQKLQRGRCAYFRHCGNILGKDFHCDHIESLKRGGTNHPSNLQLTCPTCNLTKHAKSPTDFARQIGYLV